MNTFHQDLSQPPESSVPLQVQGPQIKVDQKLELEKRMRHLIAELSRISLDVLNTQTNEALLKVLAARMTIELNAIMKTFTGRDTLLVGEKK